MTKKTGANSPFKFEAPKAGSLFANNTSTDEAQNDDKKETSTAPKPGSLFGNAF